MLMPKGKNPTSFKEGQPDPDAQQGAALGFFLLLSPFSVGLVLGLFTKDVFCLTKY